MFKYAGVEETKVSDSNSGKKIYISTTARLAFRKAWPDKANVRNHILNDFIANMFAGGSKSGHFKPRSGSGKGHVREVGGGRFIAIELDSQMKVIAVKGSVPNLPELPSSYTPPSLNGTSISDHVAPESVSMPSSPASAPPKQHEISSFTKDEKENKPEILPPSTPSFKTESPVPPLPPPPPPSPPPPPMAPSIPAPPAPKPPPLVAPAPVNLPPLPVSPQPSSVSPGPTVPSPVQLPKL